MWVFEEHSGNESNPAVDTPRRRFIIDRDQTPAGLKCRLKNADWENADWENAE